MSNTSKIVLISLVGVAGIGLIWYFTTQSSAQSSMAQYVTGTVGNVSYDGVSTITVTLVLTNTSTNTAIVATSITASAALAGSVLGRGLISNVTIPAAGAITVTIPIPVSSAGAITSLAGLITEGSTNVVISGLISLGIYAKAYSGSASLLGVASQGLVSDAESLISSLLN